MRAADRPAGAPWSCHPLQLALGLTVWSVYFVAVYAGAAVACAAGVSPRTTAAGLLVLTGLTALGLGWAAWRCAAAGRQAPDRTGRFVARTAAVLHATAAGSTLVVGLPILVVPACA